ncbi:MAG: thiamine phosphate synthase [Acidobacteriota bacterium]
MIRCYITDRLVGQAASLPHLSLDSVALNLRAGIEWIQIREKDLSARDLYELVRAAKALPNPGGTKIIVNTRIDVALAASADGAHLPSGSPECRRWRGIVPAGFLLGVSCHTVEEVAAAQSEGAGYVLFGPVFAPISKTSVLAPRGLQGLAKAVGATRVPVLALGGITADNISSCMATGAAGVAGISLFQKVPSAC